MQIDHIEEDCSTFAKVDYDRLSAIKCCLGTCVKDCEHIAVLLNAPVFSWECPWARHFRAQPSSRKDMNNVNCRRDMTEILLKVA